ncbi:piggyBac transposable element-derived protein 4-like [Cryptotermes secundus]|uniref:piggyBac transposable element-derived protein 4-like n=1 Tax=Cryptotermes secundus TaxID=105785 RepID=UPI000CD7BF75|nr:piggyBac transposable element-derived protein 4-like [Cryptotermes secundus]
MTLSMIGSGKLEKFFTISTTNSVNFTIQQNVLLLFKGRVIFGQHIPKKRKRFGIKIYKLCNFFGYTYEMTVYLGKQRKLATEEITSTHGIVLQLIQRVEGLEHKIYMDNYFSSPPLFDDLLDRKINSCGTVRNDRCGMPQEIRPKSMELKKGDIVTRVKGHLSVVRWKDKRDVYVLTNLHPPPLEGNFRDESGHAVKPHVTEDYYAHMGFVDKSDRMDRKVKAQPFKKGYRKNSLFPTSVPSPSTETAGDFILSYNGNKRLENDEIERHLKCKICDVGLCIFGCFKR